MKRRRPPETVENPFVKPENKTWEVAAPVSLRRSISPPPRRHRAGGAKSATAAVEAGELCVEDHVPFFAEKLLTARRPEVEGQPRLRHDAWLELYQRNLNGRGHHFVVHQHDHPVAGTHYDLRLQCNATSSISFAIMYGLPGDPNSQRLNRNATETRVHSLWNHLIETASLDTGTMLIWDTGEYTVLPYHESASETSTDSEDNNGALPKEDMEQEPEPVKLHRAFQQRKIKLRLKGTRLPKGYTLNLRLTRENDRNEQPKRPAYRRKRKQSSKSRHIRVPSPDTSDSSRQSLSIEEPTVPVRSPARLHRGVSSLQRTASPPMTTEGEDAMAVASASDDNEIIRLHNAYPGATNSINSIHQRRWFLSLDRRASGFIPSPSGQKVFGRPLWTRAVVPDRTIATTISSSSSSPTGFPKFAVLGRDHEISVVTGRMASDILADEGVQGYVPRPHWRPVTE